uniref:Solute carrier organic anion transporter family member n=2 Tax=Anopheles atroparvus TaxID=41427 RepID=A0AAG5DGR6_ANOAO
MSTTSLEDIMKVNNSSLVTTPSGTVQTESTKCGGSYGDPSSPSSDVLEDGGRCVVVGQEPDDPSMPARTYHCGWFGLRPKWMEVFMTPKWALFWLCWAGAVQGLVVNGFINVVITTIERRFGLRSTQTGLVASGYDIASFLCLVPVSYFGGRLGASKPRWIGWGVAVMGLGAFVFALPHFLVGQYRATNSDQNVCSVLALALDANGTSAGSVEALVEGCHNTGLPLANGVQASVDSENLSWNVWFFFTAQLLLGAGASPLYTLGVTYIDENVSKKMSSVYLGIYYTMAVVGPAAGYVIGGQLLLFYTDMFVVDASTLGLTPHSKVWVGAWWIGFVFMAAFCLLLAIPILAYPSALPGSEKLQKVSEAHRGDEEGADGERRQEAFTKIKQIPRALLALLRNPTFFFLNLAGASEGLVISGFAVFLPKLIENQFSVTAVWSALLMGIITVPAGGGGTFLGGYLVKKLHLSCSGIIKFCLFATIFAALFTVCFFLSCPNLTFAGVTVSYFPHENLNSPHAHTTESRDLYYLPKNLDNACNDRCACSRRNYEPICGADGVMYYSPCHAGCGEEINLENAKVYRDCTCINATFHSESPSALYGSYDAVNTMCQSQCGHLWMFVVLCFLVMFFTFLATMPALSATLRCVHDDQRSFALGIQWIKVRVLGTIPAPMIFGRLIDETCILWQESGCDDHGACLVYDNAFMSKYMLLLALIGKACSILFFFGAWFYYIPPKSVANDDTHKQEVQKKLTANGHINSATVATAGEKY